MTTKCAVTREFLVSLKVAFAASAMSASYEAEMAELEELITSALHLSPIHERQLLRAFCLMEWVVREVMNSPAAAERLGELGKGLLGLVGPTTSRSYEGLTRLMKYSEKCVDDLELMEADAELSGDRSLVHKEGLGQRTAAGGVPVFSNRIAAGLHSELGAMTSKALYEYVIIMARTLRGNLAGPSMTLGVVGRTAVDVLARAGLLNGTCMAPARALLAVTESNGYSLCQTSSISQA